MRSLTEHLREPVLGDVEVMPAGAVRGQAGGSCGVTAQFWIELDDVARITACAARVRGRAAAFATASALCEAARGRSMADAAGLGLHTLHASFDEMDEESRERALVVEDAFHHALGTWLVTQMRAGTRTSGGFEALVAMSGGVDSAVALHLEHERTAGAVCAATLRLWIDPRAPDPEAACCAPGSVRRARATCHRLGVAHFSVDLRQAFAARVVTPFVEAYQSGLTPNPCVGCNGGFRLAELVAAADVLGARELATGHYVRRVERGDQVLLQRGVDPVKDQSYMLATVPGQVLARMRFPLGAMHKREVRERAHALGLEQARVRESQEVCFLGGGDYRRFLRRAQALGPAGPIVDESGAVLGSHSGIASFTPGQRRGLDLGGAVQEPGGDRSVPLYVLRTEAASGRVVVGRRERLATGVLHLRDAHARLRNVEQVEVQARYGGRLRPSAKVAWLDDDRARLELAEPLNAPAPGQLACLYDSDGVVVGAGTIETAVADGECTR